MTIKAGAFPDTVTDAKVKKLVEDYLRLSNASNPRNPDEKAEEAFAALFTQDGVYQLASKHARGHKAIINMRHALFSHVPHREHTALAIYSFGSNQHELMVEGEVDYEHHHGHKTSTNWAARLKIKDESGQAKLQLLQIIVDTAAHV